MSEWAKEMSAMEEPMTISMLIVLAIVLIFVVIPLIKKSSETTKRIFGEDEHGNPETVQAKVVSKSIYSPYRSLENFNFILFEKNNGERIELAIKDDEQYKTILEGDIGMLTHIGKKYLSFKRL